MPDSAGVGEAGGDGLCGSAGGVENLDGIEGAAAHDDALALRYHFTFIRL